MFNKKATLFTYFTKGELALWLVSMASILVSFFIFDRENILTVIAALIGVTSLIFNAKGNPLGQLLIVLFSLLYGLISYTFAYYGEVITYVGMTAPMAVAAFIAWVKNPYNGNKSEVKVNRLTEKDWIWMVLLTIAVTWIFYYILAYFHTVNLIPSTISVTTSFIAVYLTFKRSAFYALGYAANDVILIILWLMAAQSDLSYLSVVVCFTAFFVNDIYGFISWSKMQRRQENVTTVSNYSMNFRKDEV